MANPHFSGFPIGLLQFLDELAHHNRRDWFQANKQRYESQVREPALDFIRAMEAPLQKISPHFCAVPKKTGGSLMRVHRDVRFSQDKRPYKTNVGIHFRHELGKDVHAPGFYLHIGLDEVFLGAGIWHPDSLSLKKIRQAIHQDPVAWKKAKGSQAFRHSFELAGDSLIRAPQGYPAEHPQIEDLKRKDHMGLCRLDQDALFDPSLVKQAAAVFRAARPYVAFLCQAIGAKC